MDKRLLKELSELSGISGDEGLVRDFIISEIKDTNADIRTDNMGNLIVFKKGRKTPERKLLISAHMDEVGFIVTFITEDGFIKFDEVGGIDRRVVLGKSVKIRNNVRGVITARPMHLLSGEQRDSIPKLDEM